MRQDLDEGESSGEMRGPEFSSEEAEPHRRNSSSVVNSGLEAWHLFLVFRVGIFGMRRSVLFLSPSCKKKPLTGTDELNDEEFHDNLAAKAPLPARSRRSRGCIGYRMAGVFGAVTATLATVLPTVCLMVVLLTVFLV